MGTGQALPSMLIYARAVLVESILFAVRLAIIFATVGPRQAYTRKSVVYEKNRAMFSCITMLGMPCTRLMKSTGPVLLLERPPQWVNLLGGHLCAPNEAMSIASSRTVFLVQQEQVTRGEIRFGVVLLDMLSYATMSGRTVLMIVLRPTRKARIMQFRAPRELLSTLVISVWKGRTAMPNDKLTNSRTKVFTVSGVKVSSPG